jgi:hypothetical protein
MNKFLYSYVNTSNTFFKIITISTIINQHHKKKVGFYFLICKKKHTLNNKKNNILQNKVKSKAFKLTKKIYYNFLYRCVLGFNSFNEFLIHIESYHQISNLNFQEIFKEKEGYKQEIKFYWSLKCQCGHKFSSSLYNAD